MGRQVGRIRRGARRISRTPERLSDTLDLGILVYFVTLDLKSWKPESAELGKSPHSLSLGLLAYFVTFDLKSWDSESAESESSLIAEVRPGFGKLGVKPNARSPIALAMATIRNNSDSRDGGVGWLIAVAPPRLVSSRPHYPNTLPKQMRHSRATEWRGSISTLQSARNAAARPHQLDSWLKLANNRGRALPLGSQIAARKHRGEVFLNTVGPCRLVLNWHKKGAGMDSVFKTN